VLCDNHQACEDERHFIDLFVRTSALYLYTFVVGDLSEAVLVSKGLLTPNFFFKPHSIRQWDKHFAAGDSGSKNYLALIMVLLSTYRQKIKIYKRLESLMHAIPEKGEFQF